jgi:catechol-2,3-dioxygenase
MRVPITRMNHAVLYVRDANRSVRFYEDVLGFRTVVGDDQNRYAFLRAPGSSNHHDIAFFTVGTSAGDSRAGAGTVGMYHLAWEVPTLDDLEEVRRGLAEAGALVGESDHGVNKSVYARDPDGLEFEVMWLTPPALWGHEESEAIVRPLDIDADKHRYGATTVSSS